MLSRPLIEQIRKSVVFLGTIDQDRKGFPHATGFLIDINSIVCLVTAKHVVFDSTTDKLNDTNLVVFLNTTDGKKQFRPLDFIKNQNHCDWIFHPRREVDVAIIPCGFMPNLDDVKFIPHNYFLAPDQLFENLDVFFLSFQPGVEIKQKISPIFRRGAISVMNDDTTFYVDAAAFPGNSGSPVFLDPSIMVDENGQYLTRPGANFIGVIGEYIPYTDYAISVQTGRTRIAFEENTGLSRVWSVRFINEIIESQAFKQQVSKMPPDQE
jgi:hypothetical protein